MREQNIDISDQWIMRFLRWFCPPSLYEGIEGDLIEEYEKDLKSSGSKIAGRRLTWNALRFFRPGILLRNQFTIKPINIIMLSNYAKVAGRNIAKRKLYSFINSFGLSIGIAFCILICLFIMDENSFDRFHHNGASIYRVEEKDFDVFSEDPANPYVKSAWIQLGLGPLMMQELPEVVRFTRFNDGSGVFKYNEKVFVEEFNYVDSGFFTMFSFKLLKGNANRMFRDKLEVVLTPAIAEKYFGTDDPIGKTIQIETSENQSFIVTGIIEAPPANSSLDFAILIPQENRRGYERNMKRWGNFNTPTFVQLREGTNPGQFNANLERLKEKEMGEMLQRWRDESTVPVPADVKMLMYEITQLPDVHLKTDIDWDKVSDPKYSYILGGIALLILLIACINYISLALTTSASRRTEVGIRKAVGAQRKQLVYQFGFESMILALISMVTGIVLVVLFLPSFNEFTGKGITLTFANLLPMVGISIVLMLLVGVLAGSYPSLFLSGFKTTAVLKGHFTSRLQAGFTRPLVVLQFALSAFLIISSMIMYRQMQFVTTKDLGYNNDQVVVVQLHAGENDDASLMVKQFKDHSRQEPLIASVTGSTYSFSKGYDRWGYNIDGVEKRAYVYGVDDAFISTLGIKLLEGRNFDAGIASDSNAIIVNEALVKDMGWTDPLNEHLNHESDSTGPGDKVIGVVKDFHFQSLERECEPMFMSINTKSVGRPHVLMAKLVAGKVSDGLDRVSALWKELNPDKPFDYSFLDEDVAAQYESYQRWMSIMGLATAFAILISCLGLFGLAGVNAVNRTKEIGIRKVMGAELMSIFVLLNLPYVWLSLIAYMLAIPFSWYIMRQWLDSFQFKIPMDWMLFAVSIAIGLVISVLTVSYHAIKTALVNPAATLKYE